MNEVTFCSLLSRQRNEHLPGTASHCNKLLLIEYNKPWSQKPFPDSAMAGSVKKYISDCIALHGIKLLLIRNQQSGNAGIRIFTFNLAWDQECSNSFLIDDYEDLLNIDLKACFERSLYPAEEHLYLVCTNGKKDKCCSKFGLPIYNALRRQTGNVWQCTHVGGDRFAPNILYLPHGLFFGHIAVEEIPAFVEAMESNSIFHTRYRGRSIYKNYEQAAEYFLLKHLDNFSMDAVRLVSSQATLPDKRSVVFSTRFDPRLYKVEVRIEKSINMEFLTCTATKESHINLYKLVSVEEEDYPVM